MLLNLLACDRGDTDWRGISFDQARPAEEREWRAKWNTDDIADFVILPDMSTIVAVGGNGTILRRDLRVWSTVPTTTRSSLSGVAASKDGRTLVAVGGTAILCSLDGGRNWSEHRAPGYLQSVASVDGSDNFVAVGRVGLVVRGDCSDRDWTRVNIEAEARADADAPTDPNQLPGLSRVIPLADTPTDLTQVIPSGDHRLVAVGKGNTVVLIDAAAPHALAVPADYGTASETTIASSVQGRSLAMASREGLFQISKDGGSTWNVITGPEPSSRSAPTGTYTGVALLKDGHRLSNEQVLVLITDKGEILTNKEFFWFKNSFGSDERFRQVKTLPDGKSFIAVTATTAMWSGNAGESFIYFYRPDAAPALHANATQETAQSPPTVEGGRELIGTDGHGTAWSPIPSGISSDLASAVSTEAGEVFSSGSGGTVLFSPDRGVTWMRDDVPELGDISDTAVVDGALFAVGQNGIARRSLAIGGRWAPPELSSDVALNGVAASQDRRTVIAVGNAGVVLVSKNGAPFARILPPITRDLAHVSALPDNKGFIVVSRNGDIIRSIDGSTWTSEKVGDGGTTKAVVGRDSKTLLVGTTTGIYRGQVDAGHPWVRATGTSGRDIWTVTDLGGGLMLAAGRFSGILRSVDGGLNWDTQTLAVSGPPMDAGLTIRTIAQIGSTLIAAGTGGVVLRSRDDGVSWTRDLTHFSQDVANILALSGTALVFGTNGLVAVQEAVPLHTAQPATAQRLDQSGHRLIIQWRYDGDSHPVCNKVTYDIVGTAVRNQLLTTELDEPIKQGEHWVYSVTWGPSAHGRGSGTFQYSVTCVDHVLDLAWTQRLPQEQRWELASDKFRDWLSNVRTWPVWEKTVAIIVTLTLTWLTVLLATLAVSPVSLITLQRWASAASVPADAATLIDKALMGTLAFLRWILGLLLLWLSSTQRALDAWVRLHAPDALTAFEAQRDVQDRRIAVDLPIRINGIVHQQPWQALENLVHKPSWILLIAGPGGIGKTTLAFRIARHLAEQTERAGRRPALLPLLLDIDLPGTAKPDDLVQAVGGRLRAAMHLPYDMPPWLTERLLRRGSLLIIVDGLSERSPELRRLIDPTRPGFPVACLIATSRNMEEPGPDVIVEPLGIPGGSYALVGFVSSYLRASAEADPDIVVPEDAVLLESCARLLRLVGDKPVTPLLATLWAGQLGHSGDVGIQTEADLLDSYVLRLLRPAASGSEGMLQALRQDAALIAIAELGTRYRPGLLTRDATHRAVASRSSTDVDGRMQLLERCRLIEPMAQGADAIRISPDPVAEHLVARALLEQLGSEICGWNALINDLEKAQWPSGFVTALIVAAASRTYGGKVPPMVMEVLAGKRNVLS